MKESIKMLLDYGFHYVQTDSTTEAELWLKEHLYLQKWTVGTISLLLRRQGKNGLPIQKLEGCLHSAILGSGCSDLDGRREALIVLIRAGTDVDAKDHLGRSVSYIACCKETKWMDHAWSQRDNHDLRLREIWTEALSACGFDAEEVISTSMCLEELSDSDNDSMSDQHEESDSAESDCSENIVNNPTSPISEIGSPENHYNDTFWQTDSTLEAAAQIDAVRQTDSAFANQYEQSLLEGGVQIDTFQQTNYVIPNQYEPSLLEGGAHIGTFWQPAYIIPNQFEQSLSEGDAQVNTPWQTDSTFANQYDLSLLEGDAQIWGN